MPNDAGVTHEMAAACAHSSLWSAVMLRANGTTLDDRGQHERHNAAHRVAVSSRGHGAGVVAIAPVSGLPQAEGHALVAEALE